MVSTVQAPGEPQTGKALLIYDGDCAFCQYCVDYAREATGSAVAYRSYQEVAPDFPDISEQQFRDAIWLVEADDSRSSGAGAAFRTLELGGHTSLWARLYRHLPGFAPASEWAYRRVANHRGDALRFSRWLFGPRLRPANVALTTWLFLRLLALVYLTAFTSFTWQAAGLIGSEGILPAAEFFAAVDRQYGPEKYALLPSLLWLDAGTGSILALGLCACGLSLLLLADRGTRWLLPLLYLCYLSLYHGGQQFTAYQWDILLLECGFLAMLLPWNPKLVTWLYRWLLFRFLLQSGLVKLASGDPTWRAFTALDYHFETQPLPNVFAWYAHHFPEAVLRAGVAFTFVMELVVPFLVLMPRRPRQLAAVLIALFQFAIILTGSYNFFNLLSLCLCLLLLDDQCLARWLPAGFLHLASRLATGGRGARWLIYPLAGLHLMVSILLLGATGHRIPLSEPARGLVYWTAPWHLANGYGLFAVMTTERHEIVFEGSPDGRHWAPYELPYKPGNPRRAPGWATPHQPRLDWQLWFAALQSPAQNRWIARVIEGLLRDSPPVLALFSHNPFPDQPPRYVRASLYRYHFTTAEERADTGNWWRREYLEEYWPVTAWQLPVEKMRLESAGKPPGRQLRTKASGVGAAVEPILRNTSTPRRRPRVSTPLARPEGSAGPIRTRMRPSSPGTAFRS